MKEEKIVQLNKKRNLGEIYEEMAQKCERNDDYLGELSAYLSACKYRRGRRKSEIISFIADVYADMDLLDLSNRYWIYYLDNLPKDQDPKMVYSILAENSLQMNNTWRFVEYNTNAIDIDEIESHTRRANLRIEKEEEGGIDAEEAMEEVETHFNEWSTGTGRKGIKQGYVNHVLKKAGISPHLKLIDSAGKTALAEKYEKVKAEAERLSDIGEHEMAASLYEVVPDEFMDKDADDRFSVAYQIMGKPNLAKKVCENSLEKRGDSLKIYVNLAVIYTRENKTKKAEESFKKAVALSSGSAEECHKLSIYHMIANYDEGAAECFAKIIEERPFSIEDHFYRAVALLNTGKISEGYNEMSYCYRIDPEDELLGWYVNISRKMLAGDKKALSLLPLEYFKDLPVAVLDTYMPEFSKYLDDEPTKMTEKQIVDAAMAVVFCKADDPVIQEAIAVLAKNGDKKRIISVARRVLLSEDMPNSIKGYMIYCLVMTEADQEIGVLSHRYVKINLCPFSFTQDTTKYAVRYYFAFGLALGFLVFNDIVDLKPLYRAVNDLFWASGKHLEKELVTDDELAALLMLTCRYEKLSETKFLCEHFKLNKKRFYRLALQCTEEVAVYQAEEEANREAEEREKRNNKNK